MQVKLLVSRGTVTASQKRGDVIDVTDVEAIRMIEAGQAEPIRQEPKPEKAVRSAKPEKATKR
jgi:hypothetical protein